MSQQQQHEPTVERRAIDEDMPLEIRAVEGKPSIFGGYAALFNRQSRTMQATVRGEKRTFKEVIAPGAFDGADMSRTEARLDHSKNQVLAVAPNSLRLRTDEKGLYYEFNIDPADPDHQRTVARASRGDIRTSSFAFYIAPGGETWNNEGGTWLRTITKVGLLEDVAPVTGHNAAYADTTSAARSLERRCLEIETAQETERDIELRKAEIKVFLALHP